MFSGHPVHDPVRMIPRPLLLLVLLASVLLVMTACRDTDPDDEILAEVGDEVITVGEFVEEMRLRSRTRPGYFAEPRAREELLEEMLRWRSLVAEAKAAGIADEPEMRRMYERQLVHRMREQRVADELEQVRVTDEEVAAFYEAHIDEYSRPARRQAAIVHIAVRHDATEQARERARQRAETALAEVQALPEGTRHFGSIARDYSDDRASRYQGGVIGWIADHPDRRYRWDPAVIEAVIALDEPGAIAPIVETDDGLYLVRLVDFTAAEHTPLDKVADGIRHRLVRQRRQEIEQSLTEALTANREVKFDRRRVREIEPPEGAEFEPRVRAERRPPGLPGEPGEEEQ